jgi:hypothetical protein
MRCVSECECECVLSNVNRGLQCDGGKRMVERSEIYVMARNPHDGGCYSLAVQSVELHSLCKRTKPVELLLQGVRLRQPKTRGWAVVLLLGTTGSRHHSLPPTSIHKITPFVILQFHPWLGKDLAQPWLLWHVRHALSLGFSTV